ncbi:hypothetical protein HYU50_05615 [Candidatus Woesearchaeota archaeon]|nr:hypothetical protein [Candidatus Woesearchaeota archaeon]
MNKIPNNITTKHIKFLSFSGTLLLINKGYLKNAKPRVNPELIIPKKKITMPKKITAPLQILLPAIKNMEKAVTMKSVVYAIATMLSKIFFFIFYMEGIKSFFKYSPKILHNITTSMI